MDCRPIAVQPVPLRFKGSFGKGLPAGIAGAFIPDLLNEATWSRIYFPLYDEG